MLRYQEDERIGAFIPNKEIEKIIGGLNSNIADYELELIRNIPLQNKPIIFICAAPRSGSTLFTQVLAQSNQFNYISNFQARFWDAPFVGGIIERELNMRENINIPFRSKYGRTESPMGPHEFGFFWYKWLPIKETSTLSKEELDKVDKENLENELKAISSLSEKPLFIKNGIAAFNASFIADLLPSSYFIVLKREYLYNAQSIYKARVDLLGSSEKWWSAKTSNINELLKLDKYKQIAGQVISVYDDFEMQLKNIPENRILNIAFEDFCEHPVNHIEQILNSIHSNQEQYRQQNIPKKLSVNPQFYLDDSIIQNLKEAFSFFKTEL